MKNEAICVSRKQLEVVENKQLDRQFIWAIAVFILIRVGLQMILPIWGRGDLVVDDFLMASYAKNIADTGWLGTYNYYALNKVPGYAFFLVINDFLSLPYMWSVGIFYSVACVSFFFAIRKLFKNDRISFICFLFLLFSPIMFDDYIGQRIYVLAIVPSLVIMVVSSYLAIFCERKNGWKRMLPWIILASLSFVHISVTREDTIWLKCFIIGAVALIGGLFVIDNWQKMKLIKHVVYICFLLIPILAGILGTNILRAVNDFHYGLYVRNDFNETYFGDVCNLLMKIEPEKEIPFVYISRNTLERAYEVSPTLSIIRESMDQRYSSPSSTRNVEGEFHRDFFVWNLRWAAGAAGLYKDPIETDLFFKQVHEELLSGFADGHFEKRQALVLSPWARPIREGDIANILKYSFKGYKELMSYSEIAPVLHEATGPNTNISIMEEVLNQEIYQSDLYYDFSGWIFPIDPGKNIKIEIYDNKSVYIPDFINSPDVYNYFLVQGQEYDAANKCRFSFNGSNQLMDIENLCVAVYLDDDKIYDGVIDNVWEISKNPNVKLNVAHSGIIAQNNGANQNINALKGVVSLYEMTWWILAAMSLIIYIAEFALNIYNLRKGKETTFAGWIMKTGLLLIIWANLLIVSVNYFETNAHDFPEHYVAGVYPVWQIFICISIYTLFVYGKNIKNWFQKNIVRRKGKNNETHHSGSLFQRRRNTRDHI